ncbi:tape measure protein [Morganella morganii subsp. sibonii]
MAQVGEIVYQVQMDVAQLLTSQRQLDQRLRNMEGGFNRTTNAVNGTERSMASLSRVAASLTAYLSVSAVTSYAEAWTVLNNKLSNSVRASESLVEVTERVFNISQDTRSSLDATATLYARLERGTRQYNTSAEDLAKLTTIINQGFIVSGATAQEAENAIIQLSQGIASGVLRGEEFNSVSEQGSRLMVALADSMDVSIGQLRAMAAEGKLTTDVVVNGLLSQGAAIGEEFSKTTQTMSQALQEAGNNITKFFGNSSTVQSFISVFNDSVVMVSENLDYLTNILVIAAGVIGSRYAGALALAGAAQVKKARDTMAGAAASRQAAMAERDAAVVLVRKTVADRDAAMSALNLAQAEYQVARGSAAEATALANVTRLKTAYSNAAIIAAQANNTLSASQARVTATGLTMANALRAVNSLLAPIGGPMGAAMLAGAAVYYFFQKAEEAKRSAHEFADSLNGLRTSMDKLTRTGLSAKIAEAKDQLDTLTQAQKEAEEEVKNLNTAYKAYSDGVWHLGSTQEKLETISRKLAKAEENLERVQNDRSKTINFIGAAQAQLNGELLRGEDLLKREAGTSLPNAAAALRAYGLDLDNATKSKQKFNAESLQIQWSDAGADLKKQLEREIKIANAPNEVEKRKLQVGFYAEDKGLTGAEVERLKDLASSAAMVGEAKKEAQKKSRDADSAGKKSASEALKSANAVADALKNQQAAVDRLNQGYKEGSVELAKYDAAKALGDDATPAQIAQAEKLAAEKFAIEQRSADQKAALDANALAKAKQTRDDDLTQLERQLKAGDVTFEQSQKRRAEINAEYAKKAAEENAKSSVTPVQEMAAQVDPVQALANEHAHKLALIKDYMNQRVITEQQGLALMNAANKEYDEQRTAAQWQLLSQQSLGYDMLTSAVDSFSGNASNAITGLITQTMSWSDAARSLGNTMLNSVVNSIVQVGVEMAKNFILGQTLGVATQAANASAAVAGGAAALAAWTPAAIAASIATMGAASASGLGAYTAAQATGAATSIGMKALTIAGARKNGGDVRGGSAYEMGEGNLPELMQIGNKLIAIPGNNGRVFSYDDVTGAAMIPKASTGPKPSKAKDNSSDASNYHGGINNLTVVIENHGSPTTVAGQRMEKGLDEGDVLRIIMKDAHEKGPGLQAIMANTTAGPRLRG